jgi:hypothetical protein
MVITGGTNKLNRRHYSKFNKKNIMKKYIIVLLALAVLLPKISLAGTTLGVTNITAVKTSATANNTYTDGWKWIFDVNVPTGEDKLQMKFLDWTNGAQSIPAGSNMHFYSAQSLNATSSDSAVSIDSANTYGNELILDPTKGQQIQVAVEIKVPTGTQGGSFSTSYGIQTTGTTTSTSSVPALTLRLRDDSSQATSTKQGSSFMKTDIFGIKPKDNTVVWVNELSFKINCKEGYDPRLVSEYVSLSRPSLPFIYVAGDWSGNDTVTFRNLNTRLSQDWGDFTLRMESSSSTAFTISSTLLAGSIKAEGNSGNSLDVSGIADITSNETLFDAITE